MAQTATAALPSPKARRGLLPHADQSKRSPGPPRSKIAVSRVLLFQGSAGVVVWRTDRPHPRCRAALAASVRLAFHLPASGSCLRETDNRLIHAVLARGEPVGFTFPDPRDAEAFRRSLGRTPRPPVRMEMPA